MSNNEDAGRASVAAPGGDALLAAMWNALKREACKVPGEAKQVVFLSEEKFRKAMAPFAAASSPSPASPVQPNIIDEDRCMFCGGKTAHEPDCSHGRLTRFRIGDKLRNVHASYLPIATVTELTARGFKYKLEHPLVISPRLGTKVGGESYDDSQWEQITTPAPVQPEGVRVHRCPTQACYRPEGHDGNHWCSVCNARECAYEIIGLMGPDVDRVEAIITRYLSATVPSLAVVLERAEILQRNGSGELVPTISLLFQNDEDAQTVFGILSNLRAATTSPTSETSAPEALSRATNLCRSGIGGERTTKVELLFADLKDAQVVHQWLANLRFPTSETAVGGEALSEVRIVEDEESREISAKLALIERRFKGSTTHDEVAALVWACRALIDADAEEAPFFTMEFHDKTVVYTAALRLYFEHAKRVLGREPYPAEVDQIETGFCNPWLEAKKPERMEKGRQLLDEIVNAASIPAAGADEGEFCPHCNHRDCECSDMDVSPDMGAKG